MLPEAQIKTRFDEVNGRVLEAVRRSGRLAGACRLVLASKTQPAEAVAAAYRAGARDFGENYVQEAVAKRAELGPLSGATWHLIGHLQSNKARLALETFDIIQTLDSAKLAAAIGRLRLSPPMRTLVEVNLGGEASKSGVAPDAVEALIETARDKVEVVGLMTIPPPGENPEASRRYFAELRELRDRLVSASGLKLSDLSMGMTEDYAIAIEEGATIVRVGRAVFGERNT
ncbi:MAG TPA: YggS family pyridoxal phosphate-dependent enzyme [Candidatus Binataceae bacterium]|nr:YggS family pyridoxal phosphate-dependent enzyme [Candidatus Binataceae bacterium]